MNHSKPIIFILLYFLISASCKKADNKKDNGIPQNVVVHKNYIIRNPLNKPVSFDIYASGVDYYADTNIYLHGTIAANTDDTISYSSLDSGKVYAIDWYYTDYTNSNWMNFLSPVDSSLGVQALDFDSNSIYHIHIQNPDNFWRLVLLDGNKPSTRWKAVDARVDMSSSSVWSQLNNFKQYFVIVFSRNYQCRSYYKDSATGVLNETLPGFFETGSATEVHVLGGGGFSPFFSTKPLTGTATDTFWAKAQYRYYAMIKDE